MDGFARISAAIPRCTVADFRANADAMLALWEQADRDGSALIVFPELALSAYSTRDLLLDEHLQRACAEALASLCERAKDFTPLALIGMPLRVGSGLFNVAVAVQGGRPLAVVPKSYLPNYREFEEARWFRPGTEVAPGSSARVMGQTVPFGTDILLRADGDPDLVVGVEICEDYWVHAPPHLALVSAGATVIANLSASNFTLGKSELRRLLGRSASDRGMCAYVYVAAGPGESSTDLAFDADAFVCENGTVIAESQRFARDSQLVTVDVDLASLIHDRLVTNSFGDCSARTRPSTGVRDVLFTASRPHAPLRREVNPHPFLPRDEATMATRCWEIFEIQSHALATRIEAAGIENLVLGVSGGLDSSHAALVCVEALRLLGRPASNLLAVTMPGLGTTEHTRGNAVRLAESLGATFKTIAISEVSAVILDAIGHPAMTVAGGSTAPNGAEAIADLAGLLARLQEHPEFGDPTMENVQARARTLLLMSLANAHRGLVVGTGDLSEKALGWSTYAGDHISMYDVNAGVPKTLIQFVIRWVANERAASWDPDDPEGLRQVLAAIVDTPISPELLPPDAAGKIAQLTEEQLGPYELHDFFLHHLVRRGATPQRILFMAGVAFGDRYDLKTRKRWLSKFYSRFFKHQFKRSCTADGPKVGTVALSPRGDWRMPSDARVRSWLDAIERYEA